MADRSSLPHGATGIEVGNLVLQQGQDKLVMFDKFSGEHYTLQAGTRSGIIDLHRTWDDENGNKHHETLFAIHHQQAAELLATFASAPGELMKVFRPLRVGWLARHGIGIVHGLDPTTNEEIEAVTRRRKKRLIPDEQLFQTTMTIPDFLEDVYKFPDGAFSLFKGKKKVGIGFKTTDEHGKTRLQWLRLKDLQQLATKWEQQLSTLAQQHAITPADYHRYPELQTKPKE